MRLKEKAVSSLGLFVVLAIMATSCSGASEPVTVAPAPATGSIADDATLTPDPTSPPADPLPTAAAATVAEAEPTPTEVPTPEPPPDPVVIMNEEMLIDRSDGETALVAAPNGERMFIHSVGSGSFRFSIDDLGRHNILTVRFDLIVTGEWVGGDRDAGQNVIVVNSGSATIAAGSFSNTAGTSQTWPSRDRIMLHDAMSGTSEVNTLGFGQDAVFPVEVTFAHGDPIFAMSFQAFPGRVGAGWGVDNLEVVASSVAETELRAELNMTVEAGRVEVRGSVPAQEDLDLLEATVTDQLGERLDVFDVTVVGGVRPSWLLSTFNIGRALERSIQLEWRLSPYFSTASGAAATIDVREDLMLSMLSVGASGFGLRELEIDVYLDPAAAARIERSISFEGTGTALSAEGRSEVEEVAAELESVQALHVSIIGYSGQLSPNIDGIGEARTQAVYDALLELGLSADRLAIRRSPIVDSSQLGGRVELKIIRG